MQLVNIRNFLINFYDCERAHHVVAGQIEIGMTSHRETIVEGTFRLPFSAVVFPRKRLLSHIFFYFSQFIC